MSAGQYLAQVHAQARELPTILRAAQPPAKDGAHAVAATRGYKKRRAAPAYAWAVPGNDWRRAICDFFQRLQDRLAGMERAQQSPRGRGSAPQSQAEWCAYFEAKRPRLAFVSGLDYMLLCNALDALDDAVPEPAALARDCLVDREFSKWVFSIVAFMLPYV